MRTALGLMLVAVPLLSFPSQSSALDQLDVPVVGQWYMPLRDRPVVLVSAAWGVEQAADVRDGAGSLERSGGFAGISTRVWRDAQSEVRLRATGVDVRLDGDAQLPHSGVLPDRLQDLRLGGFWRRVSASGAIFGLDGEVSSPSDRPYSGGEVIAESATAFARLPTTGMDAWILSLRYDSTSTLAPGIPLPGIGYQWLRPGLMATVGLPFAMVLWRPIDDWSLAASYFPIDTGSITVSWAPGTPAAMPGPGQAPWSLSAGASVNYENWLLADRTDRDDRLTFRTVKAFLSSEWHPVPGSSLRLTAGRILLREVYFADKWSDRSDDRLFTDPAWYASAGLQFGF